MSREKLYLENLMLQVVIVDKALLFDWGFF